MVKTVPVSIVETPEFLSAMRKLVSDEERRLLVDYLAYNPMADGRWPMADGRWPMADGRWPMADGR